MELSDVPVVPEDFILHNNGEVYEGQVIYTRQRIGTRQTSFRLESFKAP